MKVKKLNWTELGRGGLYLLVFAVMVFNFQRAEKAIVEKGQLALSTTLSKNTVTALVEEAKTAPFSRRIEIVDLLLKHGWYQGSHQILKQDLESSSTVDRKVKQITLQRLGRLYCKVLRYKDAELSLEQSLTQTEENDYDTRISILNDLLDVDIQAARHSTTRNDRDRGERMLNATIDRLNQYAEKVKLDEGTERMIKNHAQIALIELGRMLEVESYEHEPASRLGL